jgi:hypothetical protein
MNPPPAWLPDMAPVRPWTNDTFEMLYSIFKRDLKDNQACYEGKTVRLFPGMEDGKEQTFWHMTSRDDKESGDRLPDLYRSERLPWARPMIDNASQMEILAWDYQEGDRRIKTYVWLPNLDFLVLMKKLPDGRRYLLTSFYVDNSHTRRGLMKKFERRLK